MKNIYKFIIPYNHYHDDTVTLIPKGLMVEVREVRRLGLYLAEVVAISEYFNDGFMFIPINVFMFCTEQIKEQK